MMFQTIAIGVFRRTFNSNLRRNLNIICRKNILQVAQFNRHLAMYANMKASPLIGNNVVVDMRSDTVSQPTEEMRHAMATAVVGDDVFGEDPTTNELQQRFAQLFAKEAAIFVPSGCMANLISVMVHCSQRGAEAIVGDLSHIFLYEQGSSAHIAGVQLNTIPNEPDGTFCLNQFKRKIRGYDCHEPITALAVIENTHNMCGGKVIPIEFLDEFTKICRENSIKCHMDGARVFNAAAYLNVPVSRIVRDFDSVAVCLSKGCSAPVGSILLGSQSFIEQAHRMRKALGGAMRQVGVLAAAGLVALDTIVPGFNEDHEKVRRIAQAIFSTRSPNVTVDIENVQTNILMIQLVNEKITSSDFTKRLSEVTEAELLNNITDKSGKGILVQVSSKDCKFARLVIYRQITDEDVDLAIKKIKFVIHEFDNKM
ncbi:hypothetical protein HA402_000188 [Bradysia odoriphaga]|nr:hypothetical protein HA402_000188 [Bradysia odoriphaga]